ncbi:MAG: hypothetical protein WD757_03125 [Actinomycetota bacterium]
MRRSHNINEQATPQFCHQSNFASMQYSEPFIEWLVAEFKKDPHFFANARARGYEMTHQK